MAAALLASPSTYSPPNSPFSSDSFSDSPNLPAISSPFEISKQSYSRYSNNSNDDTPTRPSLTPIIGNEQPSWVTDELDEEWVENEEEDQGEEEKYNDIEKKGDDGSTNYSGSPTITREPTTYYDASLDGIIDTSPLLNGASSTGSYASLPESTITITTTTNFSELDPIVIPSSSTFSPPGTFIIKGHHTLSHNPEERNQPYARGEENQLQAAIRALKGPSSGLGAALVAKESNTEVIEAGEVDVPHKGKKGGTGGDRLGGLMSLFRHPSPTLSSLPPSTIPAPSIDLFTFSPPVVSPRNSWKALKHFSPADNNTTPKPRVYYETSTPTNIQGGIEGEDLTTPMRHDEKGLAPPIKIKERYLRSSNTTELANTTAPLIDLEIQAVDQPKDDLLTPFPTTPAPQSVHSFHQSSSNQSTPRSAAAAGLRLFEFQYDTFTRDHLAALVEEIDGLGSLRGNPVTLESRNLEDQAWETSFVDVPPSTSQQLENEALVDEGEYEGEAGRSSKRIRLSPPAETRVRSNLGDRNGRLGSTVGTGAIGSTGGRRIRRRVSPSPTSITPITNSMRDRSSDFSRSMNGSTRRTSNSITNSSSTRDRLGEAHSLMDRMRSQSGLRNSVSRTTPHRQPDIEFSTATSEFLPANVTVRSRSASPKKISRRASPVSEEEEKEEEDNLSNQAPRVTNRLEPSHLRSGSNGSLTTSNTIHRPTEVSRGDSGKEDVARASIVRVALPLRTSIFAAQLPTTTPINALRKTGSITTIGPNDVDAILLASASAPSRMVFDKDLGKWIKRSRTSTRLASEIPHQLLSRSQQLQVQEEGQDQSIFHEDASKSSEDPFRDFDNSRIASDSNNDSPVINLSRRYDHQELGLSGLGISAGTPVAAITLSPLDANYFDSSPIERPAQDDNLESAEEGGEWGDRTHYSEGEDHSGAEEADGIEPVEEESPYQLFNRVMNSQSQSVDRLSQPFSTVPQISSAYSASTTAPIHSPPNDPNITPRSQRSTSLSPIVPLSLPRSALKLNPQLGSDSVISTATPVSKLAANNRQVPRSVSFSDGKSTGQIEGLVNGTNGLTTSTGGSRLKYEMEKDGESEEEETLEVMEHSVRSEGSPKLSGQSIPENSIVPVEETAPRAARTQPRPPRHLATTPTYKRTTSADATFLTEASFTLSRDNLVRLITDAEPSETDWDEVRSLNLARKNVDSLVRLKEFLPQLDEADFTNNEIIFLTGIPSTIRTLLLSSNKISSFASFVHLRNLERLDVSKNNLGSLSQLVCLQHLRELKADDNQITDLDGISSINGLLRLSLKGNCIEIIDFEETKWSRLETLSISRNKINSLTGLNKLQSLSILNLDHNQLGSITSESSLPRLRVLRLTGNPIQSIDVGFAPKLRTLFVDGARLGAVEGTSQLRKLENLSVRDQNGAAVTLIMKDVRDVKRLYLSGNAVPTSFPTEQFFNLVYLELAMCQLTSLPANFASLIPNVRVLNLSFNFIDDLTSLTGLTRLNKLTVQGARLEKCRPIAKVLESMPELEVLDLRLNPITLPFYPPLILQHPSELLPPHSEYRILHPHDDPASHHWPTVDQKFRKALPDLWYFKRMTYRAVLMETAKGLLCLDGIECEKERPRLAKMLGCRSEEMRN